jgi:hypothetical protein
MPIYRVGYQQIRKLADVLAQAGGASSPGLAGLLAAGQCDLLVAGMVAGFEDYAEVPPVDQGAAGAGARELLRWAFTGYAPGAVHGRRNRPLLSRAAIRSFAASARDLAAGGRGEDLAAYGAVLLSLIGDSHG